MRRIFRMADRSFEFSCRVRPWRTSVLPVNMDRYNEKVKADVLFGVDGLAHAIRFVQ
jgi:hypothetical protein